MSSRSAFIKNMNRERVLEFEKEMVAKLDTLANVERDIADVSEKRKSWLKNISRIDESGMDVFLAKLNVLKLRAEYSQLQMTLDVLRLDGHYETQSLNYLVAATQPMEDGETDQERKDALFRLQREDSDVLLNFLEHSLQYRVQLGNNNYDLQTQLSLIINEIGLQQIAEQDEFNEKVAYYTARMRSSMDVSKKHYKKVTEEYLVLRHNARVAKEVLSRNQNDATKAREELQGCLDSIIYEAAAQRERMEKNSTTELKFLTEDLRSDVVRKENELEDLTTRVKLLKNKQKKEISTLKTELKMYNRKYKLLQRKRKADLSMISSELSNLRDMVATVEQRLSEVGVSAEASAAGGGVAVVRADEAAPTLQKIRAQLRQLSHAS